MGVLDGKVAIVTGAGHGLGRGYAVALAAAGASVVVNDLGTSERGDGTDTAPAEAVATVIRQSGGQAVANYEDVSDYSGAERLVNQAIEAFGHLDILVNNAGILRDRMIFTMEEEDWDSVMQVHLKGHFAPTRHACAYWRGRSKDAGGPVHASVINTGSLVGLEGNIGQTNYAAAKGGIAMFTIALGLEMERYGVRSNCVAPSGNTRMIAATLGTEVAPEPDEYTEWDERDPGNVAPLVVWLASDLSRHVTSQVFMSKGPSITHYLPWQQHMTVTVPDGNRKWQPEEIGIALNTFAFTTRHPGYLSRGLYRPTSDR